MPLKRGAGKKAAKKIAASSSDTEVFNNGEKEVPQELAIEAKNLPNGNSIDGADDADDSVKYNATKRSSGRIKHVTTVLEPEAAPIKKPAAKGRGKKKANENKVIENEVNGTGPLTEELEEIEAIQVTSKPKGRGGGKKAPKIKKSKTKENNEELSSVEVVNEEPAIKNEGADLPENNAKVVGGRKKKQDTSKTEEPIEVKQELQKEVKEEKTSPKNLSRNSKKIEEINTEVEPQKRKGKTSKKEKTVEKDDVEEKEDEIKDDVKEKKPTKRGRANTKAVPVKYETPNLNGDTDEVLPKKRSRKAPSVEKEIIKQKSNKRGRAQKSDKEDKFDEEDVDIQEKGETDNAANVNCEELEEPSSSNIKPEEPVVEAPPTAAAKRAKGGRKRAAPSNNKNKTTADNGEKLDDGVDNTELEDEADGSKPSKTKKGKTDTAPMNSTVTKYNKADFDLSPPIDGQTVEEPRFNYKISSWNVAGLRAWLKKDGLEFLNYEQPDIFCMQETKCSNDQLPEEVVRIPGYHPYWLCMPGGYAGVAIYSKIMPIHVEYGIGNKDFDDCGRIITAEYEKFFLINVYVPNSGRKLVNLEARMKWENLFQQFIQNLDARKPVVICGDMNVSHQELDLANPKGNTRNAGFTKEERNKMTELLALGYIDTFRHLYPDRKGAYTYWTYMANARSRNVGWRLDYFIVSKRFIKRVVDNCIRSQCMGSDHCPITLFLKL